MSLASMLSPAWSRVVAAVPGVALIGLLCLAGCAQISGTAPTGPELSASCNQICVRDAECYGVDRAECVTECIADNDLLRADVLADYAACRSALACDEEVEDERGDICLDQASNAVEPSDAVADTIDACHDAAARCPDVGLACDENPEEIYVLHDEVLADFRTCFAAPCDAVGSCLVEVFTGER